MPAAPALSAVFVTAPACHLCRSGRDVLADISTRVPLTIREVDLSSSTGAEIARRWRVPFPPVLVVEGDLVAYGRLSRRRVERELAALAAARRA